MVGRRQVRMSPGLFGIPADYTGPQLRKVGSRSRIYYFLSGMSGLFAASVCMPVKHYESALGANQVRLAQVGEWPPLPIPLIHMASYKEARLEQRLKSKPALIFRIEHAMAAVGRFRHHRGKRPMSPNGGSTPEGCQFGAAPGQAARTNARQQTGPVATASLARSNRA